MEDKKEGAESQEGHSCQRSQGEEGVQRKKAHVPGRRTSRTGLLRIISKVLSKGDVYMMAIDYRFSKRLADAGATSDHARQANLATWCASANYSTFVVPL